MSKVVYEGWMLRIGHIIGRRKIGISFIHTFFFPFLVCLSPMDFLENLSSIPMRYFVLDTRVLACYRKKPVGNMVPKKTLFIDGNCRVEDRGRNIYRGHVVYVLCVYNKNDKYHRIMMAALNIQEALIWKEKIESHQDLNIANGSMLHASFQANADINADGNASSSDRESLASAEDEEVTNRTMIPRTTIGNGLPEWFSQNDETHTVPNIPVMMSISSGSVSSKKGGESHDNFNQSISSDEESDEYEDCQSQELEEMADADINADENASSSDRESLASAEDEEVTNRTMIPRTTIGNGLHEWFSQNDETHTVPNITVMMSISSGSVSSKKGGESHDNFNQSISLDEESDEYEDCQSQELEEMHQDLNIANGSMLHASFQANAGINADGNASSSDRESLASAEDEEVTKRTMIPRTTIGNGLREWFSQTDETHTVPRIPVMMSISSGSVSSKKGGKSHDNSNQSIPLDEESDEDEDCQIHKPEEMMDSVKAENAMKQPDEDPLDQLDLSSFSGNLRRDDRDNIGNCWTMPDENNFKVRSKTFCYDKTKIPAGKPFMKLVAVDWFKDVKRMDHVARRQGCAVQAASEKALFTLVVNVQVPGSTHYSMVFYFVSKTLVSGSLLQHFVDGDDEFRNSRFKLIHSVPMGSLLVRVIVGSTPCLVGKAVDCTYIRGPKYLEIDIDLGSSTVANKFLKRAFRVINTLVVDMAFLIQANTYEELPERLIGAVRVSRLELSSAIVPQLEPNTSTE
ncbi:hypothetical protein IEQ34_017685 [Dendrobium chrysotoxum]|uniref:PH domain-containing protein n=1 Tax=Dendrobium chrysotoxum TaxID=161865 RepID=A0AAV7GA96_DENCH|nr:hypothetical protein IEQ34_017685 [Dendrobium chrysotoxum]